MTFAAIRRFLPDWFLTGMGIAIFLAWLIPGPGGEGGFLQTYQANKIGVALIFFLHGALMSFSAMKGGMKRWQAHAAIQLTTFLIFPLLGLGFLALTQGRIDPTLQLGFFFLCALPSTVSSSVALTATAQGDVPVAVFNAALSNVIGIVLTPLWMALLLHHKAQGAPLTETIEDLCLWLLLPLVVGQLLHPVVGGWMIRHKKHVNRIDRFIILLLVYTSFCDSFARHIWSGTTPGLGPTVAAVGILLALVIGGTWAFCARLRVPAPLRTAIVFCGSKKSLATGVPMAHVMFAGHPGLAMILLPIMIYHPLQLFVCGPLAVRWGQQAAAKQTISPPPESEPQRP